jgi:hypothetical protein
MITRGVNSELSTSVTRVIMKVPGVLTDQGAYSMGADVFPFTMFMGAVDYVQNIYPEVPHGFGIERPKARIF